MIEKIHKFPPVTFGECPRCGGRGGDDPNAASPDATATDTTGNGYELQLFRGDYLCDICIKEIIEEEDGAREAEKHRETQLFLSNVGTTRTIT